MKFFGWSKGLSRRFSGIQGRDGFGVLARSVRGFGFIWATSLRLLLPGEGKELGFSIDNV